jgi:hypothetical protein
VAISERATTLTVTATSKVDPTKFGTAMVTVYAAGTRPTVTSVTVIPNALIVEPGDVLLFTATVNGNNSPAQTVTWTVSGSSFGTSISEDGILSVSINERATTLFVTATSMVDTSKYGMAMVTVDISEETFNDSIVGNWEGYGVTAIITSSDWTLLSDDNVFDYGFFTISDSTAMLYSNITYENVGTAVLVDNNTITLTYFSSSITLTRQGMSDGVAEDLTAYTWATGYVSAGYVKWYRFYAMNGTSYYIQWEDIDNSSTYTGDIMVSAYYADGTEIFSRVDVAGSGYFTATRSGYIWLEVEPYSASSSGDPYRIRYYY